MTPERQAELRGWLKDRPHCAVSPFRLGECLDAIADRDRRLAVAGQPRKIYLSQQSYFDFVYHYAKLETGDSTEALMSCAAIGLLVLENAAALNFEIVKET